ncbi:MAG: hypothetical protein HQL31_03385 [Planctomycetes bacterium]|nr:hypothetical protein [Planctomycetota bacterium]
MYTNISLFLIVIGLLVGAGCFVLSNNITTQELPPITRAIREAETKLKQIETDLKAQKDELFELKLKLGKERMNVKDLANRIAIDRQRLRALTAQKQWFVDLESMYAEKKSLYEMNIGEIRDDMEGSISQIERNTENVEKYFAQSKKDLDQKQGDLSERDKEDEKTNSVAVNQLENQIADQKLQLKRENLRRESHYTKPSPQGEVLEVLPDEGKIVINLGKPDGIRQNFKFEVFSTSPSGDRYNKGMMIIKEVGDFTSVGLMMDYASDLRPVVIGDKIGSPAYSREGHIFFIAGQCESKYNNDQIAQFLQYYGNRLEGELSHRVDLMVAGKYADKFTSEATALGIKVIDDDYLIRFLGD